MKRPLITLGLAAMLAIGMAGCGGDDGAQGPAGPAGPAGPPGPSGATVVRVADLTPEQWGALEMKGEVSRVTIASKPVVEFKVTDAAGKPVVGLGLNTSPSGSLTELSNIRFSLAKLVPGANGSPAKWVSYMVTSDTGAPQRPNVDRVGTLVDNGDGTYKYTFHRDVATIKDQVAAATVPAGSDKADLGDLTYAPNLQHRLAIQISGREASGAVSLAKAVNIIYDFVPATGAKIAKADLQKDVVNIETCNNCHGRLAIHGSGRVDTAYCTTCHTDQRAFGRPRVTSTAGAFPALTETKTVNPTTGITSYSYSPSTYVGDGEVMGNFTTLIHKIHQGHSLTKQNYHYAGIAFNNKAFSMLDDGQRMCAACHDSTRATKAEFWNTKPSREACVACHDNVNFATGANHVGGAWSDDSTCALCHKSDTIKVVHRTPNITKNNPTIDDGLASFTYDIKSATVDGANNAKIEFRILRRVAPSTTDAPVTFVAPAPSVSASLSGFTGGPTFLLAYTMSQDGIATPVDYNNLGRTQGQPISVSIANLLSTNNAANGTLSGPDANGYYTANILGSGNWAFPAGAKMRSVSLQGYYTQVSPASARHAIAVVKSVTGDAVRRQVVDAAKCGNCHEWLELHGGNRTIGRETKGEIVCVTCHNPALATSGRGLTDAEMNPGNWDANELKILAEWNINRTVPNAALQLPVTTNNFKDMIHGIHAGRARVTPFQDARNFRGGVLLDFRRMDFPGILNNCETCHLTATGATTTFNSIPLNTLVSTYESINSAYATAILSGTATPELAKDSLATANGTDAVRTPFAGACSSCHDGSGAKAHMQQNGAVIMGTRMQALGAAESCAVCHGPGAPYDAAKVHK